MPNNVLVFKNGKYSGQSVEQAAVRNYEYLDWMYKNHVLRGHDLGVEGLSERISKVLNALNNFVPTMGCAGHKDDRTKCDKTPEYLSIIITNGEIPRGGNKTIYGPIDISADSSYAWCHEHSHGNTSQLLHQRAIPYEIAFKSLLELPDFPKWIRKNTAEVLLKCAGFKGKKSKPDLADFIDNLKLKSSQSNSI